MKSLLMVVLVVSLQPGWLKAAVLDNPNAQTGVIQSGIYPIFGWKCEAGTITIRFDGATEIEAAYGTARGDTVGQCGDTNNGFSLLWNWNLLGDGVHIVEALDDGVVFASVKVTVVTLDREFPKEVSGTGLVTLSTGQRVTVEWSEPRQGFIVTAVSDESSFTVTPGLWLGSELTPPTLICFHVAADGTRLAAQGSPCATDIIPAASLRIRIDNLEGCKADLEASANITIVNHSFSHTEVVGDSTVRITGAFQLPNFATGTVRVTNNNTAITCEGPWLATPFSGG